MVHVLAKITVAPGKREQFLEVFHALVPKVHAEKGCIEYGPAVDVTTALEIQEPLGDDEVMIVEKWESVATLEAHLASPHMAQYREGVKEIVVGTKVHVLEPA